MKKKILEWLELDIWMKGILQEVGLCKVAIDSRILQLEAENDRLRTQNSELIEELLNIKRVGNLAGSVQMPIPVVKRLSVREQIIEQTKKALEEDRDRQALERRKQELING